MDSIFIGRLETRYRLPPSRMDERRRLDRIRQGVLNEALERALERVGIAPEEELCIRRIQVLVRLPMSLADHDLSLAWSLALTQAIRDTLDRGPSDWVVRYANRRQALVDFALGIAAEDHRRAWAWRQLGFGEVSNVADGPRALYLALIREPTAIVPVLEALAKLGNLKQLYGRLEAGWWEALATAALEAAGVSFPPLANVELGQGRAQAGWLAKRTALRALVRRMLAASRLTPALTPLIEQPGSPRLALTALVLLAGEPTVLRRRADEVRLILAIATFEIEAMASPPNRRSGPEARADEVEETQAEESELSAGALRQHGFTRMGGLLFLTNLLETLALPDALAADERFAQRSLRWVLHRLALTLLPLTEDDPAALAFIGLGPEESPPTQGEEPPTAEELEAVSGWAEQLSAALRERLDGPALTDALLLDRVCRRRAQVVADPGWLEIRFSLDEVATEIRRTGLDLDPEFLPWLGVVMKFVYE